MSVIWYKVWFDLWQRKGRTLLAVLSIAAGVFAIGTIFGMVDQLLSTMDASHLATNPSHVNVILRQPVDQDTARALERIDGVSGVEPLSISNGRYRRPDEEQWTNMTLVQRSDYEEQRFDNLTLLEGEWPEGDQIVVERLSHNVFDIDIGDEVIIELEGTDRAFEISGIVRHPFVPPPDFGGTTHFIVSEQMMARIGTPVGLYNQLLVQVSPYSEDFARDRTAVIKDQLAKQGIGMSFAIYQEPDEHWGRPFVLGVTYVLRVLAIVSLLASVILVVNTMTAVITQQTDQIGVIKAIGGSTALITRIYLTGVLVYGLLAALIALPLGMMAAFGASQWLLTIFNITYDTFQFSMRAVIFQVLAALLAPLLAALWPVLQGAGISVREAIASYGLGGDFGYSRFDQWVEKIALKFLSSPYAIALGNIFRRKGRLLLTQSVLIIAGTMFILVLTLSNSLSWTLESELNRRGYDIRFNLTGITRAGRVEQLAEQFRYVTETEAWLTITGIVLQEGEQVQDTAGLGSEMFGVPAGSNMYAPYITHGRWLQPDDTERVAVISQDTADFNGLDVDDMITVDLGEFGEAQWRIIGLYQAIAPDPFTTDPIYVPEQQLVDVSKRVDRATQLLVAVEPGTREVTAALKQAILNEFEEKGIGVNLYLSRTLPEERAYAYEQFSIVTQLLLGLAVVMGVVGGIGLMGALSISVVERTREIGVLRAIGAESHIIMGMFIMEGVLQGVLSWFVSVPLAFALARPMAATLGDIMLETSLDFAFDYTAVFIWLGSILLISILASIIPAYNATRISVRESLAYA